ncbi:DUF2829 domain-containing protein [Raoultella ornithinolytica]|uniref:DUF2829 domain-containing protein n=1 Tax=Raoultella ornithinolytica TaxID=54291 RepID=UPI003B9F0BAA
MDLSNKQSLKLPKYQSIKIVEAAKIFKIEKKTLMVSFRKHVAKIEVDQPYLDKHKPEVGGYFVRYEDGYESYSPKGPFESGYLSVDLGEFFPDVELSFSYALEALKEGVAVARKGWNGKAMYLRLVDSKHYDVGNGIARDLELASWIGMKTADGKFVPWLASQTDILAEDWVILGMAP